MILDLLTHWQQYRWGGERFRLGFKFLESLDPTTADGTYRIDGDNVYCMVQTYETRPRDGHQFEAHRTYADIQYLVRGEESILWAPTSELTVTKPYKPDIEFFALVPSPTDLALMPGRFCVLFPQDAHAPCTIHGAPCTVRKAVVKVKLL
jgi:YhcH/YjgK/YiaL family protein